MNEFMHFREMENVGAKVAVRGTADRATGAMTERKRERMAIVMLYNGA